MSTDKDDLHTLSLKQRIERLEAEVELLKEAASVQKFIVVSTRNGSVCGEPSDYKLAKEVADYLNANPIVYPGNEGSLYIVKQA